MTCHNVSCYIVAMQYSLYIQKAVNERFKDETEKSALVNQLLKQFYDQLDQGFGRMEGRPQKFKEAGVRDFLVPANQPNPPVVRKVEADDSNTITTYSLPEVPPKNKTSKSVGLTAKPTLKPIVTTSNSNFKFCPNSHPIPEGRTKCMGKGCKYSV